MLSVGECRIDVGIERAGGGVGVAFDAGYLHKSAHRVARHPKVMLQSHLGGVFYLRRTSSEELARGGSGHGAGHAHLTLASYLGSGDAGVVFHDVAYKSCRGQRAKHLDFSELAAAEEMIERAGHHSARPARRSRNDHSARSVFLADGEGVGKRQSAAAEVVFETLGLHQI